MLDNEFDKIFRDRLLDHPSKVRPVLWKQVHTHLVRHTAFWKWYFVGPSAIAAVVTGYFLVTTIRSSAPARHSSPAAAVATYNVRPNSDSSATAGATAGANPASTTPTGTNKTGTTPANTNPADSAATMSPTATSASITGSIADSAIAGSSTTSKRAATASSTANRPAAPASSAPARPAPAPSTNALVTTHSSTAHRTRRHSGNSTETRPGHRSGSKTGSDDDDALTADAGSTTGRPAIGTGESATGIARASSTRSGSTRARTSRPSSTRSATTGKPGADPTNATSTDLSATSPAIAQSPTKAHPLASGQSPATAHPPIPAELTAPPKLATLRIRPDIAAATTSPKKPQQLTLPARRTHKLPPMRVDAFGSPEYFTAHIFGFSYGAGARVTVVYKKHFTFTTGVQYLRVAVKGTNDSMGFPSGYIKDIHLPLLLGYTTGDDRFTFSANAGVLLSLYAHSGGEMTHTGLWSNRDGASAYLGLNFASHVTRRVSIFAEPYVKSWYYQPRRQFLPYNPPALPFPAWSVGLMVGIRYNF